MVQSRLSFVLLGLKQLGMRGTFVRLASALRMIQPEVGRRYNFPDCSQSMKSAEIRVESVDCQCMRGCLLMMGFTRTLVLALCRLVGAGVERARMRKAQKSQSPRYLLTNHPTKEGSSWRKGKHNSTSYSGEAAMSESF
jgi:hypothetical protein